MRKLLAVVLLFSFASVCSAEETCSITVKPQTGLTGTASLTFHADGNVTLLAYESAAKLSQDSLVIDDNKKTAIRQAINQVLDEMLGMKKFAHLPEYKQSTALAVTADEVTRSITTRRYTDKLKALIEQLNQVVPENRKVTLEKK